MPNPSAKFSPMQKKNENYLMLADETSRPRSAHVQMHGLGHVPVKRELEPRSYHHGTFVGRLIETNLRARLLMGYEILQYLIGVCVKAPVQSRLRL